VTWLVFAAWLFGVLASYPSLTRSFLAWIEQDGHGLDSEDRGFAMVLGAIAALLWPFSLAVRFVYRRFSGSSMFLTPREQARQANEARQAAEDELRAAKKMAREADLPWPDKEGK
jgi:hypothetical protein